MYNNDLSILLGIYAVLIPPNLNLYLTNSLVYSILVDLIKSEEDHLSMRGTIITSIYYNKRNHELMMSS